MYVQCVLFVGESTQNACLFSLAMINGIVNTDNGEKRKKKKKEAIINQSYEGTFKVLIKYTKVESYIYT